jgi:putative spermidine/putrescine transport system ATP-binding protein
MSPVSAKKILELKDLERLYGNVVAVGGVSMEIVEGEFLTLLGPSGSGKTTTLLMIAGFENPTSGEILFQDKPINRVPPEKRNIGMVFQNYALFPHMTIFGNLAFPLKMRGIGKQEKERKVKEVLDFVELPGYEHRSPKQLSGGQQQRIALARALIFDPPILLMDEPLGALDKKLREHMQLEIKHIQSRLKKTVIYVTHDQEEAMVMSDRIAVMNKGEVQQIGTPGELYEKPINKFVAGFIGESNFIEGKVIDRKGDALTIQMDDESRHQLQWNDDVAIGDNVCFSIRPEKLFILHEKNREENALGGIIQEIIYIGETTRYKVIIGKEKVINVREMNTGDSSPYKKGEKVKLSWKMKNLRKLEN